MPARTDGKNDLAPRESMTLFSCFSKHLTLRQTRRT